MKTVGTPFMASVGAMNRAPTRNESLVPILEGESLKVFKLNLILMDASGSRCAKPPLLRHFYDLSWSLMSFAFGKDRS